MKVKAGLEKQQNVTCIYVDTLSVNLTAVPPKHFVAFQRKGIAGLAGNNRDPVNVT
jgi:hypothetical protein